MEEVVTEKRHLTLLQGGGKGKDRRSKYVKEQGLFSHHGIELWETELRRFLIHIVK